MPSPAFQFYNFPQPLPQPKMAGDWIKIEHTTPDKPEVFRMAAILKIDPDAVVGKLIRFWSWVDQQTLDGADLGVTDLTIDHVSRHPGFNVALREVGWLGARSGSLSIPNFDRHNGQTAKARGLAVKRKASQRERDSGVTREEVEIEKEKRQKSDPNPSAGAAETPKKNGASSRNTDPRHHEITSRWSASFVSIHGFDYAFQGRDAAALKRFLPAATVTTDEFFSVASAAWVRAAGDKFARQCKQAATIHGLCGAWNDIRAELARPTTADKPAFKPLMR